MFSKLFDSGFVSIANGIQSCRSFAEESDYSTTLTYKDFAKDKLSKEAKSTACRSKILGPRPECIGKEASPDKTNIKPTSRSVICPSSVSLLDPDCNNSKLDVTHSSTTSYTNSNIGTENGDISSNVRHRMFVTHIQECNDCQRGNGCILVDELENDISSFFEIDSMIEQTCQQNPTMTNTIQESSGYETMLSVDDHHVKETFFHLSSGISTISDTCSESDKSEFMGKTLFKPPVTGHKYQKYAKGKKKSISKKLKMFKKYICNYGQVSNHSSQGYKTLAIL